MTIPQWGTSSPQAEAALKTLAHDALNAGDAAAGAGRFYDGLVQLTRQFLSHGLEEPQVVDVVMEFVQHILSRSMEPEHARIKALEIRHGFHHLPRTTLALPPDQAAWVNSVRRSFARG